MLQITKNIVGIQISNYVFRLAKSYGLELKMKMTFAEYFEKHSKLDTHFLNRITALEVLYFKYYKLILELYNSKKYYLKLIII